ncbi:MAG: MFS transporter, partial [Thermodesulfobacteriota bacterium]|nr:MFS transporter [Thermodesulfobacteriota bacterium]
LLGSAYFYCYALMQFPAGLLSDSIGPRRTVTAFLLIAAAGSILFGFSPNIQIAFAGRVLVGFGVSMVFIPTMKILSQWFRKHEFALMAGILNAVGGIGVLAGTWALALMTVSFGWRFSFKFIGICTFVIVILVWLIVRDKPRDKGWPAIAEIEQSENNDGKHPEDIPLMEGARRVVSEKYFWPVAVWFFLDCGIFFGFGGLWGGPYLMHVYGMSRTEAGTVLSMIAWGMIIGSPLLGLVSDKLLKSRKKPFIICMLILSILLLMLYLSPDGFSKPSLMAIFFIFSICSSSIVVIGFTTTKELFPVEIAGTSVGTVNLFPFLGGAVYMPLLGRILDAYPQAGGNGYSVEGYSTMLLVLFVSSVVALICTFAMKETFQR